jgi:hypothetical protein
LAFLITTIFCIFHYPDVCQEPYLNLTKEEKIRFHRILKFEFPVTHTFLVIFELLTANPWKPMHNWQPWFSLFAMLMMVSSLLSAVYCLDLIPSNVNTDPNAPSEVKAVHI